MSRPVLAKQASTAVPDLDGLLCALVLAPGTFSRNRFYRLFCDPEASRVRSRAACLGGMVRDLARRDELRAVILEIRELDAARFLLRYRIPVVGLERTAILDSLEEAAVRYALDRAGEGAILPICEARRRLVESAIQKLGEGLPLPSRLDD